MPNTRSIAQNQRSLGGPGSCSIVVAEPFKSARGPRRKLAALRIPRFG